MRIVAGEFRSRVLRAPGGLNTRPTSDRLRETLFNVLEARTAGGLAGSRFLDLYAGSGANGLEALSRGAQEAIFVEQAEPALAALRANIAALGVSSRARVVAGPVARWLQNAGQSFDLVFLDPPYDAVGEYATTLSCLGEARGGLLGLGALAIAEHRRVRNQAKASAVLAENYGVLRRTRVLEQGEAALSFYTHSLPTGEPDS